MKINLADENATLAIGGRFFRALEPGCLIFLYGDLGAGKTTFVRGCLRAAGYLGKVKSPTYTLVEEYRLSGLTIFHFDLYRLADGEELEWMGIRDYLRNDAVCFIEWPQRGQGLLPPADIELSLQTENAARLLEITARTAKGQMVLSRLH